MSIALQRGFSMIEVLISIFVLAMGVLGAAGMQLAALRTSQQSVFQAAALQLAAELADKMRANDQAMKQAEGDNPFLDIDYYTTADPTAPGISCYGEKISCDAEALAAFDIYEWQKRLQAALPPARVVVCQDSTPWDDATGGYKWECDGIASGGAVVVKIGWQSKNPDGSLIRDATKKAYPPSLVLAAAPYIQ